jgi:hypothetical protein
MNETVSERQGLRTFVLAALLLLLASACGGGDGDPPAGAGSGAAGVWTGTLATGGGPVFPYTAIVSGAGDVHLIRSDAGDEQFAGTLGPLRATFSGLLDGFDFSGAFVGPATLAGSVIPGSSLNATLSGLDIVTSQLVLSFDPAQNPPSSLAAVQGVWVRTAPSGIVTSLSVGQDGGVSGSATNGETFSGRIFLLDSAFNAYGVELDIVTPQGEVLDLAGHAALIDRVGASQLLVLALTGPRLGAPLFPVSRVERLFR